MALTVGTDTYIMLTDADAYMASRLHADYWPVDEDSDETKEAALRLATQMIDAERYVGAISSTVQALAWPRVGVVDSEGRVISDAVIPSAIAFATAELALALIRDDLTRDTIQRGRRARSETVGMVSMRWDGSVADRMPEHVRALIRPFLIGDHASARLINA